MKKKKIETVNIASTNLNVTSWLITFPAPDDLTLFVSHVNLNTRIDNERSLFFPLSSSCRGKDIANTGARIEGVKNKKQEKREFAMSFPRIDELKRQSSDCSWSIHGQLHGDFS